MGGNIYKRQREFVGSVTTGTAQDNLFSDLDILGGPAILMRVMARITVALDAPDTITVKWREDLGSGVFTTLATFVLPVSVADEVFEFAVEREDHTTEEVVNSQPDGASGFLIGEQRRDSADGYIQYGPAGEISIESDGGSAAGAAEFWLEVQRLPVSGDLPNTLVSPA